MDNENNTSHPCQLKPHEQTLARACIACEQSMTVVDCSEENSPWIFRHRKLHFGCKSCNAETQIYDGPSIAYHFFVILTILALALYVYDNNGYSDTFALISDFSLLSLLGLFYLFLILIGVFGLINSTIEFSRDIANRFRHPLTEGGGPMRLILTLLMGLVPWAIAIGFGMFDWFVHDLDEWIAIILIPIFISPIVFAGRFGLAPAGVFLSAFFWLVLFIVFFDDIRRLAG